MRVALVHDYLTQRGGAERVVLAMLEAFPDAPLHVSLYDPDATFPEFRAADVRPLALNRLGALRAHHRLALPVLAPAFSRLHVEADAVLCSSSGWAHGVRTTGRKIVYCYTPARWLYQAPTYLRDSLAVARPGLSLLRRRLVRWDQAAAASADRYLVSSREIQSRVQRIYGRSADVLPPPHDLDPEGALRPVAGLEPGFLLCVSRLLPYKNVGAIVDAVREMPGTRLVLVGAGPQLGHLRRAAPASVSVLGSVADDELRWLYSNSRGLVAASYEDYGITPLEAAAFGKPSAVLRWGGFLDTVVPGRTGVMFAEPRAGEIREALVRMTTTTWSESGLRAHARGFGKAAFVQGLRAAVAETLAGGR